MSAVMCRLTFRRAGAAAVALLATVGAIACEPVLPTNPFGHVDAVVGGAGTVIVQGWAIDSDTTDSIPVHVYLDGTPVVSRLAASPRPDVGAAYPASGPNHGFDVQLGGLYGGQHTVCVYAINAGPGQNALLGCGAVELPTGAPVGRNDGRSIEPGPDPADPTMKTFVFWGWAIDPDTTDPVQINARVVRVSQGPPTDFDITVVANELRPDVAAAYPAYGGRHGFTMRVTLGHNDSICLTATNVGPSTPNKMLMCDVPL
jgi:hypothetical protein